MRSSSRKLTRPIPIVGLPLKPGHYLPDGDRRHITNSKLSITTKQSSSPHSYSGDDDWPTEVSVHTLKPSPSSDKASKVSVSRTTQESQVRIDDRRSSPGHGSRSGHEERMRPTEGYNTLPENETPKHGHGACSSGRRRRSSFRIFSAL